MQHQSFRGGWQQTAGDTGAFAFANQVAQLGPPPPLNQPSITDTDSLIPVRSLPAPFQPLFTNFM